MDMGKTAVLSAIATILFVCGGCGSDRMTEGTQTEQWDTQMQENGVFNDAEGTQNDVQPDGVGIYTGGPNRQGNNTERNTYGMKTDENDTTLGDDIKNAWEDVKEDVKNIGKENDKEKR